MLWGSQAKQRIKIKHDGWRDQQKKRRNNANTKVMQPAKKRLASTEISEKREKMIG